MSYNVAIKDDTPKPASKIARVPWNPWLGLLYALAIFYVAQIVGALLVSIYPSLQHWTKTQATDWLNNSVPAQFVFVLLAEALTIGGIYLFLRRYNQKFSIIGLKKPKISDLGWGILALPLYILSYLVIVGVVSHFVPSLDVNQEQQVGFANASGGANLTMAFISLVILPPLAEEIIMRGFVYSNFKKALPAIWAVLLTSVLFAAAHLPEGGDSGPLYIAALDTFILSLVLIYLREKTGSLWASITLHACKNGIAFVALFVLHL